MKRKLTKVPLDFYVKFGVILELCGSKLNTPKKYSCRPQIPNLIVIIRVVRPSNEQM